MKTRPKLTPRQEAIFRFLAEYFAKHQTLPVLREVMRKFDINGTNGVVCHLTALVSKGYLRKHHVGGKRGATRYEIVGLSELIAPTVRQHVKAMLAASE